MMVTLVMAALLAGSLAPAQGGAISPTQCSQHTDGFCIDSTLFLCPAGWMSSESGCGFLEKCCYPQTVSHQGATSAPGSHTNHDSNTCGVSTLQPGLNILGAEVTTIEAHPWQISLRERGLHICGGTIIDANWVMTADHCVENTISVSRLTVLAGSNSISDYSMSQVHHVSRILVHTEYRSAPGHDIALLKLSTPVNLTSPTTRKICLPGPTETFDDETCVSSGWGRREKGHVVDTLHHVALPVVSAAKCRYYMRGVHDKIICAGRTSGGNCQGDAGGPLVCLARDGSWKQAGIVSTGDGCSRTNMFGFYTAVGQFNSWIQSVMKQYNNESL